jgi:hypothetical protein
VTNRSELPIPDGLVVGTRVTVTNEIIRRSNKKADGVIRDITGGKPTNEYISVGVEFDELPGLVSYFYPFEVEVNGDD